MNFKEKKEKLVEKYDKAIRAIAMANDVDMGVAFDMLVANEVNGGKYTYVNKEEFAKDYEELVKAE